MEKIKRFIECYVPVTICNLKCSYCYIIQEGRRTEQKAIFKYSPEQIGKALSKERLGGTCYVSICGGGETLVPPEIVDIVKNILLQGHYVNITTNGTLTNRFNELCSLPEELLKRLHFAFSLHYIELNKKNLLEKFFENVNKVKKSGCSFLVQLNLSDEYVPYINEIKKICKSKLGAYPQIAATRDESEKQIKLFTSYSVEEYTKLGKEFNSPLFDFTMKNFMVKRKEFCYAGDWSFLLNLATGEAKKCYFSTKVKDIFKDINEPIKFEAVGNSCRYPFCVNSSHFMTLGVIPSIETPSYSELRNRENANWYSDDMRQFLNSKLYETNKEYSKFNKLIVNIKSNTDFPLRCIRKLRFLLRENFKDGK